MDKIKLIYIVTIPLTADLLLKDQLKFFSQAGYRVVLISSKSSAVHEIISREEIEFKPIPFKRKINIPYDVYSLIKLIVTLYKLKPDIVNISTPKASLLGMIASYITMVPIRIYLIRGLRYETLTGLTKVLYIYLEKLICLMSTNIVSISNSIKDLLIRDNICKYSKINILLKGSSNGINLKTFFHPVISLLQKPPNTLIIGYVGRLCTDKGTPELIRIFKNLEAHNKIKIILLIVGDFDSTNKFKRDFDAIIAKDKNIIKTGFVDNVYSYLKIMDIFIFPSKREGFGNAIIEASLSKLPIVAFDIPGVRDAVINNSTGLLAAPNNLPDIINKVQHYIDNPNLRLDHGLNGHKWVIDNFDRNKILKEWLFYYETLLTELQN